MMKKILFALLFIIPLSGMAQLNISVQLPPGGFVQKSQLWNLILANNREDVTDVNIKMSLQNALTGEVVLSANSGNIILGKGVKIITDRDAQPVIYNYNSPDLTGAYLPMGSYVACYRAYFTGTKGEEPLGDECIRMNIDPLSPPLLNTPADKSEIETPYPQFTWMPPTPFDMFTSLSYEISVCEIKEGQKPVEAIQYNMPVYTRANLTQPTDNYSSSFEKLEEGKTYAWQIAAINGMSYSVKTDVWSFTVKKKANEVSRANPNYILLGLPEESKGIYNLSDDLLNIKYYSFEKEHESFIRIMTADGSLVEEFKQKIIYGDNFLTHKLSKDVKKGVLYKVVLTTEAGKVQSAIININK
jgi:hypothetical protein